MQLFKQGVEVNAGNNAIADKDIRILSGAIIRACNQPDQSMHGGAVSLFALPILHPWPNYQGANLPRAIVQSWRL